MHRVITGVMIIVALCATAYAGSGALESYRSCRECHSDIFNLWMESLHGQSYTDPPFQAAYLRTTLAKGSDAAQSCLRCHAPVAYIQGDTDPNSPAAAEGVTCSFCHSVESVNHGQWNSYYNLDTTSGAMYGPYEVDDHVGHVSQTSKLHVASELCAGCHEYVNEHGVGVLETYSEWKASSYPGKEVNCQNCHMPIMFDLSIADDVAVSDRFVTAHEFRGGHSKINLSNAARLQIKAQRSEQTVQVEARITNAESGHKLPTGIPIRKLVLTVVMTTSQGAEISSARKVYRKVLTDRYGTIIESVPEVFMDATRVYSDNRIKPGETRSEYFTFDIPEWISSYKIEAVLNYEYARPILSEENISVEMARQSLTSASVK